MFFNLQGQLLDWMIKHSTVWEKMLNWWRCVLWYTPQQSPVQFSFHSMYLSMSLLGMQVYSFPSIHTHINLFHTVDDMDYVAMNPILIFDSCETRQCFNVTLLDHSNKNVENVTFTLTRTPGLNRRIGRNPVQGFIIAIGESDGEILQLVILITD